MLAIASAGATSKQNPKPRANTTAVRVGVSEEPDGAATRSRPTGAHGIAAPAPSQCCFPTPKANSDPCGCAAPAAAVYDGGCKGSQANGKSQCRRPTGTRGSAASATGQRRNSKPHAATPGLEAFPVPSDCNERPQEKNPSFGKAMRQLGASRMQLNPRQRLLAMRRRWLWRLRKALCARTKNAMPKPRRRAPRGIFAFAHNTKAPLDRGVGGRNPKP